MLKKLTLMVAIILLIMHHNKFDINWYDALLGYLLYYTVCDFCSIAYKWWEEIEVDDEDTSIDTKSETK